MNFILTRCGLAFVGLVAWWAGGAALAASPRQADATTHCPCDGAAAKHAIHTKGTGSNRVAEPTATPVQQVAPAASGAGGATGTTKRPGHVSILR